MCGLNRIAHRCFSSQRKTVTCEYWSCFWPMVLKRSRPAPMELHLFGSPRKWVTITQSGGFLKPVPKLTLRDTSVHFFILFINFYKFTFFHAFFYASLKRFRLLVYYYFFIRSIFIAYNLNSLILCKVLSIYNVILNPLYNYGSFSAFRY